MTNTFVKPRFDPTFNYGQVMQAVLLIITLSTMLWKQAAWEAETRKDISALTVEVTRIAVVVNPLTASQNIQDERIQNLAQGAMEARQVTNNINNTLGRLSEDIAVIKAKLSVGPQPGAYTPR